MLNVAPSGTSDVQELISATGRGKLFVRLFICRCIRAVHLFRLSVCLPIHLFICPSIHLSVCLPACLSIHLSVCLSFCSSSHLSVSFCSFLDSSVWSIRLSV